MLQSSPVPAVQETVAAARRLAQTHLTILIQGETGVGKDVLANLIHMHSKRDDGPFVAVNCAAIPADLIESEFFGHKRGAFTDAVLTQKGKFEQADGGTLFLDEVGEMSHEMQVKLLRALETGRITPVGGTERAVDVRIVAATNRDLKAMVAAGTFRSDLYFRLNIMPLSLPPLRARTAEIEMLAQHFLQRTLATEGLGPLTFSRAALNAMRGHAWPGNIRELGNSVLRGAYQASIHDRAEILPEDMDLFAAPGAVEKIAGYAREVMTPDQFTCFEATHLLPHEKKKSLGELAGELRCKTRTISNMIEAGKKNLLNLLVTAAPDLVSHPVLRVRAYKPDSALTPALPPLQPDAFDRLHPAAAKLIALSSVLFNDQMHEAVCHFYLAAPDRRKSGREIGEFLSLSTSGAHQRIKASRDILEQAAAYEDDSATLLSHPMFTGTDPTFLQRRFAKTAREEDLALDTVSARLVFERAVAVMKAQELRPFLETHLMQADKKKPVAEIARAMGRSPSTVEEYILLGKTRLIADLEQHHPELLASPIMRQRIYTKIDEYLRTHRFFDEHPLGEAATSEAAMRRLWANVLLNTKAYHMVAWAEAIPPGELEREFRRTSGIEAVTSLDGLYKTLETFDATMDSATAIEELIASAHAGARGQLQVVRHG